MEAVPDIVKVIGVTAGEHYAQNTHAENLFFK
jgi:hypothetical protein